ncbi:hypothetical protein AAFF_G00214440 [Aldrovandia affinis]|uniref:Uncharacterized protein n=1 Tax=Aldrovandia affinis TaxID=143900 RepID=A0AAD7RGP1_9TELE|nr:hypothetical protein AAFF_G00214440 [Aldrovandia affinis]
MAGMAWEQNPNPLSAQLLTTQSPGLRFRRGNTVGRVRHFQSLSCLANGSMSWSVWTSPTHPLHRITSPVQPLLVSDIVCLIVQVSPITILLDHRCYACLLSAPVELALAGSSQDSLITFRLLHRH